MLKDAADGCVLEVSLSIQETFIILVYFVPLLLD
jgi:hypothetical protein